jgi:HEAT repeat protein
MTENSPYLGLRPFLESEKDKFFGRQHEIHILTDKILAHRLTLLVAASGVGKSSLLQAGVMPALRTSGMADLIYHNEWAGNSPAQNLKDSIVQHFVRQQRITADYQPAENLELMEFLRIHALLGDGTMVLLLDQFEEFFYYQRFSKERDEFIRQLATAIHDADTPTAFVFSMREDFAMEMEAFKPWYAGIFNTIYRIEKLEEAAARLAIVEPVKAVGFAYQPELLDVLLKDLGQRERSERLDIAHLDEQLLTAPLVEPPHLQIVCQQLWLNTESSPEKLITQKNYEKLGEAQGILKSYFNDKMVKLSGEQQRLASRAFDLLVSQHGAKMSYPLTELASLLNEENEPLQQCLDVLQAAAILRRTQRQGKPWYELYHDIFAKSIVQWNQAYKRRQLRKKLLQRGSLAVLAIAAVLVGNDGWQNYHQRHFRLGKETVSERVEMYQGSFDSWDLFHQQKFLYESDYERKQIEADKRFETIAIAELNQSELMQLGQLPLANRFADYAQVGLFESADKVFDAIRRANDKELLNRLIAQLVNIRDKKTIDRLLTLKGVVSTEKYSDEMPAIKSLATMNTQKISAKLIELLADKDTKVSMAVIKEILYSENNSITPKLIELLQNKNHYRDFEFTIKALVNLKVFKTIPIFINLVKNSIDDNGFVDYQALLALEGLVKLINESENKRINNKEAKIAISELVALVNNDKYKEIRNKVTFSLGKIEDPTIYPILVRLLNDSDPNVLCEAISALSQTKYSFVTPQIYPLLQNNSPCDLVYESLSSSIRSNVNKISLKALGRIKNKQAIPELLVILEDNNRAYLHTTAIEILVDLNATVAIPNLIRTLKDNEPNVRAAAINSLSHLKAITAIPKFIESLKDTESDVRIAAINALSELKVIVSIPILIESLQDKEPNVRIAAIKALSELKVIAANPNFIALLKDNDSNVRVASMKALRDLRTFSNIIYSSGEDDEDSYYEKIGFLNDMKFEWAIYHGKLLVRLLEEKLYPKYEFQKTEIYSSALELSKVKPKSVKLIYWQQQKIIDLEKSLKDGTNKKVEIANDLGYVVVEKAVSLLIPMLKDEDSDVVEKSLTSLSQVGEIHPEWLQPSSQQIIEAIKKVEADLNDTIKIKIQAELIATAKNDAIEKQLFSIIQDPTQPNYLRFAALEGLENSNRPEIGKFLLQLLQAPKQDAIEMPVSHLLAKMAYQPAKATMQQRLKVLENAKAQWRAVRDNYHYKPTTDNDAVITDDPNAPKAWQDDYKIYQYAYALARIAPASDGIELLAHPLYQARQAAIRALAEKADGNLIKKLVEHHQQFNPEDLPSPLPYSTYQAIDKALEQVEYTGTAQDLAILKQIKGTSIQTQMKDQQHAINERFDWTIEELDYRLTHSKS